MAARDGTTKATSIHIDSSSEDEASDTARHTFSAPLNTRRPHKAKKKRKQASSPDSTSDERVRAGRRFLDDGEDDFLCSPTAGLATPGEALEEVKQLSSGCQTLLPGRFSAAQ